jgi:hypothetical protein
MKKIITTIVLGLILAGSVYAGQIYGSLKEEGRAVSANVTFEVTCGGQRYGGQTDGFGAYAVNAGKGKCTLTVHYKGQAPTSDLYSYDNPARYDFDLILVNGQYTLRRK